MPFMAHGGRVSQRLLYKYSTSIPNKTLLLRFAIRFRKEIVCTSLPSMIRKSLELESAQDQMGYTYIIGNNSTPVESTQV